MHGEALDHHPLHVLHVDPIHVVVGAGLADRHTVPERSVDDRGGERAAVVHRREAPVVPVMNHDRITGHGDIGRVLQGGPGTGQGKAAVVIIAGNGDMVGGRHAR